MADLVEVAFVDAAMGLVGCEEADVWPWAGLAVEGGTCEGAGTAAAAAAFFLGAIVNM